MHVGVSTPRRTRNSAGVGRRRARRPTDRRERSSDPG
jgi:hypothetical protein